MKTVDCPHCGKNTFAVREPVMEGWTKKGEILRCASCGAVIGPCAAEETAGSAGGDAAASKRQALAALLGDEAAAGPVAPGFLKEEKRFCRDCAHRVMNAFRIRCMKHDRDVGPMDDCPDFQAREGKEETQKP